MQNKITKKSVCIIGAGPSGLSALNSFLEISEKGEKIPELVCYEKQSNWLGQWNYTYRTGVDKFGETIHSSMYSHLWANLPKELLELPDFLFKNYEKKNLPSFLPRESVFKYLNARYSKKKKLRDLINFNTTVKDCFYNHQKKKFIIKSFDFIKKKQNIKEFDFLICASGRFSYPNLISYKGIETFKGRILHSHDFKNAEEFENTDVLLIGSSFSAQDIASQCYKFNARSIVLSYRAKKIVYTFPEKIQHKNQIDFIKKNIVFFKDGSSKKFDSIIFCTGYIYNFPFLEDKLKLRAENKKFPDDLYKGVVFLDNINLFYMGMQTRYFTFPVFEVQAYYIRDCILNKIQIPEKNILIKEVEIWKKENLEAKNNLKNILLIQAKYLKELNCLTDCPKVNVDQMILIFEKLGKDMMINIMSYKDQQHESVYSGIKGEKVKKTWVEQMEEDEDKI